MKANIDDGLFAVETTAADHGEIHSMSMEGGVMRKRKLPEVALPVGQGDAAGSGATSEASPHREAIARHWTSRRRRRANP